jgi:DNA-binding response OmpR family regulator
MSKKVLIIDESKLVRDYLSKKLNEYDLEIIEGLNGLDGSIKLRNEMPDLIVMDYFLSRKSSIELLIEKKENRNTDSIPVIMMATNVDRSNLIKLAKYNVKKIFSKPIKMDSFIKTVSELVHVELDFDETPSIIEAHFNDDILFIEIAQGLNKEKIELLKYKITELLDIYQVETPKVLIMMSNLTLKNEDAGKLNTLFETIVEYGQTKPRYIKVLTSSGFVKKYLNSHTDFCDVGVADNLSDAMDDLLGLKPDDIAHDEVVHDKLLKTTAPKKEMEESFQLRFDSEKSAPESREPYSKLRGEIDVAVVDDDIVIQELVKTVFSETNWNISVYENGKKFVDDLPNHDFSLVFLDLMMPEMNGFQVLQYLKEKKLHLPIIVFSALSRKETVVKAVGFGIHSYLIKPLKPTEIMNKAIEVVNTNF